MYLTKNETKELKVLLECTLIDSIINSYDDSIEKMLDNLISDEVFHFAAKNLKLIFEDKSNDDLKQ